MSALLKVKVRFNGPQLKAWKSVARRRAIFLGWGRGVGKSYFIRRAWYLLVAEWDGKVRAGATPIRGIRIIVLMPTLVQFKSVHWDDIENELGPGGEFAFLGAKLDKQRGQIKFPGGSWIKPFPAAAANAKGARGMRADVVCPDEVDDIDAPVYDSIAIPWLSATWSLGMEIAAGTPTRGRHGLWYRMLQAGKLGYRLRNGKITEEQALCTPAAQAVQAVFEQLPGKDWPEDLPHDPKQAALAVLRNFYAFHATYENAPETVSPLAVARAMATTPKATFDREWRADPDSGEGLIYVFDDEWHVRMPPPLSVFHEFIVGADFGWVDPGVLLLIGIQGHGNDAVAWVLQEYYESACTNTVWDERAKIWNFAKFWPDPSRPDRAADFRKQGCNVGEANNEIKGGLDRVADLLHRRKHPLGPTQDYCRLYVAPGCTDTIREFGLYRRKKKTDGTFGEEPEDKNNHAMDALRYALFARFGRGPSSRYVAAGR